MKSAVLARYDVNEEAYRQRFRTANRKDGESNRELAMRLMDLQTKWLRKHDSLQAVKEAIGLEQFLNTLPMEKRAWVSDKKPETCVKAGELADEYELARKHELQPKVAEQQQKKLTTGSQKKWCTYCKTAGHLREDCRKLQAKKDRETEASPTGGANNSMGRDQGRRAPI